MKIHVSTMRSFTFVTLLMVTLARFARVASFARYDGRGFANSKVRREHSMRTRMYMYLPSEGQEVPPSTRGESGSEDLLVSNGSMGRVR